MPFTTLFLASNRLFAQSIRARVALFLIALAGLILAGCSSMRLVDSDVSAFPKWTADAPKPGTPYRFERLPSQQTAPSQQDALEAQARTALAKVGMEFQPEKARYSVQVTAVTQLVERPGYGPYDGFGGSGVFLGGGSRGGAIGLGFPLRLPETYYRREVAIVMRDLAAQQVTYETRANHDGVWRDTPNIIAAMLDSALIGFPEPPAGTRRVNVEIPR
jgi:Domain of unknown function (DUF4136)